MKNLPSWLLFAALSLAAAPAGADELTPQKRADIERLLEMTGATKIGKQWGQALGPAIAERVRARLKKEGVDL